MTRPTAARKPQITVPLHGPTAFEGMRRAGRVAAEILDMIGDHVVPGVTTAELDQRCHEAMLAAGAVPATIDYRGYRHATCISLNHVVCHGIPGERKLKDGDVLNIDVTVIVDGWHGDSSRMYFAGNPPLKARRLCRIAFEALWKGLRAIRPGAHLGDVGHAIQSHAEAHRCSVVRDYCGHGIGRVFHDAPSVLHYGRPGEGLLLEPGMFFTVEPMVNLGTFETKLLADGWTVVTKDRQLSAQFEHTVGVTEDGCEVFTLSPADRHHPDW